MDIVSYRSCFLARQLLPFFLCLPLMRACLCFPEIRELLSDDIQQSQQEWMKRKEKKEDSHIWMYVKEAGGYLSSLSRHNEYFGVSGKMKNAASNFPDDVPEGRWLAQIHFSSLSLFSASSSFFLILFQLLCIPFFSSHARSYPILLLFLFYKFTP